MSIEVEQLTKVYGEQKAIDHISFSLKKGEIVGFLGPNGAGKSTTMKIITGFLPPTEGTARVCGFDVTEAPLEVKKRVGYLPESNPLYYEMYVKEYLHFVAEVYHLDSRKSKVDEVIKLTGLESECHKKISALSKGYKQRVGLAQALLHDPEVLILDEPTGGLDPNQLVEIRKLIREMGQDKAVILSTHIMQEVQAMCDRVIIINNGKIVTDKPIGKLQALTQGVSSVIITLDEEVPFEVLQQIEDVQSAEILSQHKYKLLTTKPEKVRKSLLSLALTNNWNIISLQSEEQSLEEIFHTLTK